MGWATQRAGDDLRSGMLLGSVFPVLLIVGLVLMRRRQAGRRGQGDA